MSQQTSPKPTPATVRDLMSTDVITVNRNDELTVPDTLMRQKRIRHLPILDEDGALCGITTQRDLFRGALLQALGYGTRAEDQLLTSILVKEVMTENPHTVSPETPLSVAARTMVDCRIGCLPVLDGSNLIGILTEGDFVKLAID